jgi:cytochrome c biogenesis protein CcdA
MVLLIIFSFLAGFVTIFSPCIISIAPILFAAGSNGNHKKPLGIITGLILSFSFFTLTLSSIVETTGISHDLLHHIALTVVIIFGLTMILPSFQQAFTAIAARIAAAGKFVQAHSIAMHPYFISGFVLGIALGLLWTPCAGPILATITTLAAAEGVSITSILMAVAYATGAAIPMLIFCFGGAKILNSVNQVAPYAQPIRKLSGIIIIASALAMAFGIDVAIQKKFASWFPEVDVERNPTVQKELEELKDTHPQIKA